MTVKADWDKKVEYNKLTQMVDENPRQFYNNFEKQKNTILKNNYSHDFNSLKTD